MGGNCRKNQVQEDDDRGAVERHIDQLSDLERVKEVDERPLRMVYLCFKMLGQKYGVRKDHSVYLDCSNAPHSPHLPTYFMMGVTTTTRPMPWKKGRPSSVCHDAFTVPRHITEASCSDILLLTASLRFSNTAP